MNRKCPFSDLGRIPEFSSKGRTQRNTNSFLMESRADGAFVDTQIPVSVTVEKGRE